MFLMMTTIVLLLFFSFLAMFMHIFGKSDQNMVVIVSNERQTTEQYGLLVTSSHGSELHVSGLSREPPVADEATTPTTQSRLLMGTTPTSTSLSLKY